MYRVTLLLCVLIACAALIVGCSDEEGPTQPQVNDTDMPNVGTLNASYGWAPITYEVTIENLSTGQPLSPFVVATHRRSVRMFKVGKKASPEIEAIAEDGNNMPMFELLDGADRVTQVVNVGVPLTRHGTTVGEFTDAVTIEIAGRHNDRLSMAGMLICTNDGFTGLDAMRLPWYGQRIYWLKGYDAGTEENTEESVDIVDACSALGAVALPGDPDGNENDAVDTTPHRRIRKHRGIKGQGELTEAEHGWEGAVAKVTIKRVMVPVTYSVTIENVNGGQPISPAVAATHSHAIRMFRFGHKASPQIEAIAEDGNNVPMFEMLSGSQHVTQVVDVGVPLTRHGTTVGEFNDAVAFEIEGRPHDRLSIAGMLICTNDGFTGLDAVNLPHHGQRTYWAKGLDAGTEDNTEQSTDIVDACSALGAVSLPGDPDGNENEAVDSDPHRRIRKHRGIEGHGELTRADHGWDGPVLKITVVRMP